MNARIPLVALLVVPALAHAQARVADTLHAEPVVVTATHAPLGQGRLPVAVTVITGDELRARGITTVADALADVTSAYVARSGSQGATTALFLRGGESKYVKVLVDGVAVNDPGGAFDFASLTTDNVERVEVVRGPASVVHGSDAATGVVHVITRRGVGAPTVESVIRAGVGPRDALPGVPEPAAQRLLDATVTTSGAFPAGNYSLAVASHGTNGLYAFNNRYRNTTVSGRFELEPAADTDLRVALRMTDYQYNYPTDGAGNAVDSNAFRTDDRVSIGVEFDRRLGGAARAVLALSSSVTEGGTDDQVNPGDPAPSSYVSQDRIRRRGAELRVHLLPLARAAVTAGVHVEHQDQRSQSQSTSPFGPFNSTFSASRRNLSAYTEVVLTPAAGVTATLGGRLDDNEAFGTFGTARAGVSWTPLAALRLRATAGNAFREPTFFENFSTGFVSGNPELNPERTLGADAGVDYELPGARGRLSVTAFAQRFRDMIDYESTGASCGYSYCNVALASSRGVEAEGRIRLAGALSAGVGATLMRTRVEEPGYDSASGGLFERGERLLRRPALTWNADLAYATAAATVSARVHAVGERDDRYYDLTGPVRTTLPAYELVELAAEYRWAERTATTLRVENVGNVHYQSVYGFLAPRRMVHVGVRVTN